MRLLWMVARIFCPSFPRHLAAHVAATQTPGPESVGEADEGPGLTPVGGVVSSESSSPRAAVEPATPRPPVQPEVLVAWHADRAAPQVSDTRIAAALGRWTPEEHR